ncbi:hypothetical protein C1I92_02210 [Jiangella anatolica]|uniref:Uncharacterized protein n=1 Tax=Jiangella anatolica TaxID=2670374 RepID=A0A2W2C0R7_9ACTN|nr:hypothetical protein C1I92_02210 [Jiangella anatolica]
MSFDPEYGETLVAAEDLESLTEQVRALVCNPARKADVFDLEQAIWAQVAADRLTAVLEGSLTAEEILTDHFVRRLHSDLYARIWTWAGRHRCLETNVGVSPEQIAVRLRSDVDDLRGRWLHAADLTPRALGVWGCATATVLPTSSVLPPHCERAPARLASAACGSSASTRAGSAPR